MVDLISSKTKSIASTACTSGSEYSHIYRLMKSLKRRVPSDTKYKQNFSDVQREEAINIYFNPEVSYCLPDTKYSHLQFMSCTIDEAYMNHYLEKAKSECKMARSTFTALKPLFVRSIAETPMKSRFANCKCEYCQNFGLLCDTLIGIGFKGIPKNHSCSIEISWCSFRKPADAHDESTSNSDMHPCSQIHESWNSDDQLPGKNCVLRQCSACGVEKYCKSVKEQNKQLLQKQLLKQYIKQLKAISLHQFMKIWQLKNFNMTLRNL